MMDAEAQSNFARSRLPWLVAAGALIVYLFTLNRWISLNSLYLAAFLQEPPYGTPLLYLLSLPFRVLPGAGPLLGLNVMSALLGACVLALLARSIALLPHDRTREERRRETGAHGLLNLPTAWLPPVLAVMVLGTQLTFWEHATAATGEMLDLALLAYVVRCLLEYRVDQREGWLMRVAFVYGLAITNNWAMIGFFPLMLAAVIWICGAAFFRVSLLVRLTLLGLAGLSFYLLMPLLQVLQADGTVTFWGALRLEWAMQRYALLTAPRLVTFFASLTSLVPLAVIGVRWPSNAGDTSALGNIIYNNVFRLLYVGFLAFILWMMLDPTWSPRSLIAKQSELSPESRTVWSYLSFYYLSALALGYFVGYCLLVFGQPDPHIYRRRASSSPWLGRAAAGLTVLACLGVVGLLVWRNAPTVRDNNGLLLREYAEGCWRELPDQTAVVVSDHQQLYAVMRLLQSEGPTLHRHLLVNTRYLPFAGYQRQLYREAPEIWPDFVNEPTLQPGTRIPDNILQFEIGAIAVQNPTYYLHWSFGFFFEPLYLEPRNLIHRVQPHQTHTPVPPLEPALLEANTAYWEELWPRLQGVVAGVRRGSSDARMVGRWYSQALNTWGVTLQRAAPDLWATAAQCFERARLLNPDNVSAAINLEYQRSRQAGRPRTRVTGASATEHFGPKYRNWSDVMRINGPIDDPHFCVELGTQFLGESLFRQAAAQFRRALELAPENNRVWLQLAQAYFAGGHSYQSPELFASAVEAVEAIRQQGAQLPLSVDEQIELGRLKGGALFGLGQPQEAERELRAALAAHARDPGAGVLVNALAEVYVATGRGDDALELIEAQMPQAHATALEAMLLIKARVLMLLERYEEAEPPLRQLLARNANHAQGLLTQGALYIQLKRFADAVPPLDRLLELAPRNVAGRLNRAIALLQGDQLAQSRQDYQQLLKEMPPPRHAIHFGLGEIAWRQKDFAEAKTQYEAYLSTAPAETDEATEVQRRLQAIRSGNP